MQTLDIFVIFFMFQIPTFSKKERAIVTLYWHSPSEIGTSPKRTPICSLGRKLFPLLKTVPVEKGSEYENDKNNFP